MGLLDGILDAVGIGSTGVPWGAVGNIASGILGFEGQQSANEMNQQIAQNNSAFNADQAQLNRDFQERMRSTQYQTAVGDMKAAGLNPMLAYSQGGAGNLSGSTATAVQPAAMQNAAGAGIAAAAQAAQVDNTAAMTDNIKADTANKQAELAGKQFSGPLAQAQLQYLKEQAVKMVTAAKLDIGQRMRIERELDAEMPEKEAANIDARTAYQKIQTILSNYDVPGAKNEAEFQKNFPGASQALKAAGQITNSASAARRAIAAPFVPAPKTFNIHNH